jgi:hypothetical protein
MENCGMNAIIGAVMPYHRCHRMALAKTDLIHNSTKFQDDKKMYSFGTVSASYHTISGRILGPVAT